MVDDGYEEVINIDISSVVIEAMKKKYSNRSQLKCITLRDLNSNCNVELSDNELLNSSCLP